jgi:uncharacterized protein YprB with RNaseH-like and TPR domain
MLERSFIILPGIGRKTEQRLWSIGVGDWQSFLDCTKIPGFSRERKAACDRWLARLYEWATTGQLTAIAEYLPVNEHWRLYPNLHEKLLCLDVEVDGMYYDSKPSVIGLYDPYLKRFKQLIAGQDLNAKQLRRELERYQCIVTFNGKTFDLPYLQLRYPNAIPDMVHLDLRHLSPRVGLKGGLKHVEYQLGLAREPDIIPLRGEDAVRLWRVWVNENNLYALDLVLRYNRADTVHLKPIIEHVYTQLAAQTQVPDSGWA